MNPNDRIEYMELVDSVMVKINGEFVTIPQDDDRFEKVLTAIREQNWSIIPAMVDESKRFDHIGLRFENGILYTKDTNSAIPMELADRIMDFSKHNEPVDTLLKFWENLKQNPSFNSRKMLFKFLEHNGHPITTDGCFIAYRSVTSDFKDHHTKKMDNSVGRIVEVSRDEVDDNPNNTCSHGLHVATWSYASDFGSDRVMVEVKIRPQDVVAVPTDYNGTKMRVSRFEVLSVCEAPRMNEAVYRPEPVMAMMDEYEEDEYLEEEEDSFDFSDDDGFDADNEEDDEN